MLKVAVQTATASSPIVIDDSPPSKQSDRSEKNRDLFVKKRIDWQESAAQSRKSNSPLLVVNTQKPLFEANDRFHQGVQRVVEEKTDCRISRTDRDIDNRADSGSRVHNTGQHLLDSLTGKFNVAHDPLFRRMPKAEKTITVARENLKVGLKENPDRNFLQYSTEKNLIESKCLLKRQKTMACEPSKGDNSLFPAIDEDVIDYDAFESTNWVKGQASMTDNGCVRDYNEDRITVIPKVERPERIAEGLWPKCSFFGIYDGHGGDSCSQFLMDNLHNFVFKSNHFPHNPKMALLKGFEQAEQTFIEQAMANPDDIDISGSCALVVLVVGDLCYIANLGDSRVIGSYYAGKRIKQLSTDMKPCDKVEQLRITLAGGKVYQSSFQQVNPATRMPFTAYGPVRVFPGRLNVSRSFGDIEAKEPKFGGKAGVIIAVPDVKVLKITSELDYFVLASDGVYDKLENEEVINSCWRGIQRSINSGTKDIDKICRSGVEEVMKLSLLNKTQDNISTVMISFKSPNNLHRTVTKQDMQKNFHERLCNMLKKSKPMPKSAPQEAVAIGKRMMAFDRAYIDDGID